MILIIDRSRNSEAYASDMFSYMGVLSRTIPHSEVFSEISNKYRAVLMLAPEWVRDYIVVHELCHLKQMNHSDAFWAEVARFCPRYLQAKAWLKDNAPATIARL